MRPLPPIDVAIADKNPLVLSGLRALLTADARFNLVVTASDGERFLEAVRRFRVMVGVIGWRMPFTDGEAVLAALRGLEAAPRIVVYTGAEEVAREVLAAGGAGFVSKREPPARLLDVLAAVADGQMVFPFMDLRQLTHDPLASLSPRERDILGALGSGRTNAELARAFGVSTNTVKFHLRNLFDKLAVRNRAQAVQLWFESRR